MIQSKTKVGEIMNEKYSTIKTIFSGILDDKPIDEIRFSNYHLKNDYIKDIYADVIRKNYPDMKSAAIKFLGITHSQFDAMILEIISLNLYCDFALMLQILGDKKYKHEYFLTSLGIDDTDNKKTKNRIMKRLNPMRLKKTNRLYIKNKNKFQYSTPTLIRAFKDTLFVKRSGTNIMDISEVFIDIFKFLFIDTDEQANDKRYSQNIKLIKSYRIWKFTPNTIQQIATCYQNVAISNNPYKYAEIVFLEKLFGLMTLNEIFLCRFKDKDLPSITDSMSLMQTLGYSSMTKLIASKITRKNYYVFEDMISSFIYPLCESCITTILSSVLSYTEKIVSNQKTSCLENLLHTCLKNTQPMINQNMFKSIENHPHTFHAMFRTLFNLPDPKSFDALAEYLTCYVQDNADCIVDSSRIFFDKFYCNSKDRYNYDE